MSLTCCDCGQAIQRSGPRGRRPLRCSKCKTACRNSCRPRATRTRIHWHVCQHCQKTFATNRKKQTFCSTPCMHLGQRKRVSLICANSLCGKPFVAIQKAVADGRRYCCKECSYPPPLVCQNPKCGRQFRMKHVTKNQWQNKGKYCCPECYRDHRWGGHRPRLPRSLSARKAASGAALATSLRKRCKVFCVTFDPACTRQAVLDRDGWRCQKCGVMCNKEYVLDKKTKSPHRKNAEHDHIVPLSVFGSPGNTFENSQCLCRVCNSKKGNTPEGQLRLCFEENAWGSAVRVRRQQNLKSSGATLAAAP